MSAGSSVPATTYNAPSAGSRLGTCLRYTIHALPIQSATAQPFADSIVLFHLSSADPANAELAEVLRAQRLTLRHPFPA
ncbi:MAG: hypothetical protein K2Y02_11995 [Burkholderiaceae bacterium]|nr:hypothetical protein [Burkholderiaceae bacterium]